MASQITGESSVLQEIDNKDWQQKEYKISASLVIF